MRASLLILVGLASCRPVPDSRQPTPLAQPAATIGEDTSRVSLRHNRASEVASQVNAIAEQVAAMDAKYRRASCVLYLPGFETRSFGPRWRAEADQATNSVIIHAKHDELHAAVELVERVDRDPLELPR